MSLPPSMNTYLVEFRLEHKDLRPSDATKMLGLSPTLTREAGVRFSKALWAYGIADSKNADAPMEWASLQEAISSLLPILSDKRELIEAHFGECDKYWWCGAFQETADNSFELSPRLLSDLGNFGASLVVVSYSP